MEYLFWGHVSVWITIAGYALYLKITADSLSKKLIELSNKE